MNLFSLFLRALLCVSSQPNLWEFLSYFVKPSVLGKCCTGKSLMNLQITGDNILSKNMMFVGQ